MQHKPQTLVILSPGFPENESDSTCLPLQQVLIKTIRKNYPHIKLVVLAFHYPFKKQSYNWNGIPVQAFGGKSRGKLFRFYNWIKVWLVLKKIRENNDIAGILSFWLGECAFIGHQFAKKYHLKHRCWVLGQDAKTDNPYYRKINPDGRSLIALSDFIARSMYINHGVMPRYIIPGGIDGTLFGSVDTDRNIDILGAGSLIPLKQYHLFIEVVCRLRLHFPNLKVVLCGNGPDINRLELMVRKLKLQQYITFTGEVSHQEVLNLMQRSKVFLHTSAYEGLGMVCLEALYAGAKVVSLVKPMDSRIPNWHIANSTMHMAQITTRILQDTGMEYTPVAPYMIDDIAAQIVSLYLDKPMAISRNLPAMALNESVEV